MGRLVFSGHESFTCKQFWLKKGFDFAQSGEKFSADNAVVQLGVGKNMVNSIRFWGKAFGIIESKENVSQLGEYLFGEGGRDLYLEDTGSIWLLHYFLIKKGKASIYDLIFNEYQNQKEYFTKDQLHQYLKRKCENNKSTVYNENTINRDITVFLKNYLKPTKKRAEIEERFVGLLHEINLIEHIEKPDIDGQLDDWYGIRKGEKETLPYQVVLFSILDFFGENQSISFKELLVGKNAPGRVFGLDSEGLYSKIEAMVKDYQSIVYSETAGNRTLQLPNDLNKWDVLNEYYN